MELYPTSSEPISFPNAPLIQISVELGWDDVAPPDEVTVEPSLPAYIGGRQSDATSQLRKRLGEIGYVRSTREFPEGFPVLPGRALITWDPVDESEPTEVRSGIGYFGVTGMPPYKTWVSFQPKAESAIDALLSSRQSMDDFSKFDTVTLRYVDSFSESLTFGWTPAEFVAEVLGFKLQIPSVIAKSASEKQKDPAIFVTMKADLSDDLVLNLAVGEATVNGSNSVVLDMAVTASDVKAELALVTERLESAHALIRSYFISMTDRIASRLQGVTDDVD